ncbi:hypothetical protein [Embleya scabrispora]|uniref:hypothetical protein n=1 Tax=Embleya scabrispora TaxID=159449 RepID=UPI00037F00CA|nr:hypothetical protein [Embleya scabrispora]MYS82837.1 hypothetical protein [Streptomyces sp. SID5474]
MMPQYVQVGQMNYAQPPAHTQPQAAIPAQHEHGGAQSPPQSPPPRDGSGGGGRGAMIGAAVAIVLVIAVIAGVLLMRGNDDKDKKASPTTPGAGRTTAAPSQTPPPSSAPSTAAGGKFAVQEAEDASPSGGAVAVAGVPNSTGSGMIDMQAPGSTVTVKLTAPKAGSYYLAVRYVNAGPKDDIQSLSIMVNGTDSKKKSNLKSWGTPNSVTGTWNNVTLVDGTNEVALTCAAGDKCKVALDQIWLSDQKPDFNKKD